MPFPLVALVWPSFWGEKVRRRVFRILLSDPNPKNPRRQLFGGIQRQDRHLRSQSSRRPTDRRIGMADAGKRGYWIVHVLKVKDEAKFNAHLAAENFEAKVGSPKGTVRMFGKVRRGKKR